MSRTWLFLLVVLTGCSQNRAPDLSFAGSANLFVQTEKRAFGGAAAIENSFVEINGEIVSFYDPSATGAMVRRNMATGSEKTVLEKDARFSYVMEHAGRLFNFVTIGYDIVRMESFDGGHTWSNSIVVAPSNFVQWNPGVVVDQSGKWHMLIEADELGLPNQSGVACYYLTSFDGLNWIKHGRLIERCGNPYLVALPNGILVIHGDLQDVWRTTASTFDGFAWRTHRDKFLIRSSGVHVCDPHAIETNGRILLSVSVDQNSITLVEANDSFQNLFNLLKQN